MPFVLNYYCTIYCFSTALGLRKDEANFLVFVHAGVIYGCKRIQVSLLCDAEYFYSSVSYQCAQHKKIVVGNARNTERVFVVMQKQY